MSTLLLGALVDTASAVMAQRLGQKSSKGSSPYQVVGTWLLARTLGRATWIPTRSLCSVSWASSQHGCSVTRTNFPREEMEWKPRHFYDLASEVMQHHFCHVLLSKSESQRPGSKRALRPHFFKNGSVTLNKSMQDGCVIAPSWFYVIAPSWCTEAHTSTSRLCAKTVNMPLSL